MAWLPTVRQGHGPKVCGPTGLLPMIEHMSLVHDITLLNFLMLATIFFDDVS